MLGRLATSLAATSVLVLTATAPALADHALPDFVIQDIGGGTNVDGHKGICEVLAEADHGYDFDGTFDLVVHDTFKYHPPQKPGHWWIDTVIHKDGEGEWSSIDITVHPDIIAKGEGLHVIVKGGTDANVYLGPDLTHLTAPNGKGISYFIICKVNMPEQEDEEPPADDEEPPADDEEPPAEDEEGKGGGESTPTAKPEPTKTPAPVPTAVPAGIGDAGGSSMAPVGFAAAALMLLAGGASLVRRRFAQQS